MFELDKQEFEVTKEALKNPYLYVVVVAMAVWAFYHFGFGLPFIGAVIFGIFLVLFTFIDLKHFILPDILMIPAFVSGVVGAPLLMVQDWVNMLAGVVVGFGFFFLIAWGFFKIRGYHGLGFGDVKFLGVLGAWTGATSLLPLILMSSFLGVITFILRRIIKGTQTSSPLPYGPFLALSGWLMLLYDEPIWITILQVRQAIIQGILG